MEEKGEIVIDDDLLVPVEVYHNANEASMKGFLSGIQGALHQYFSRRPTNSSGFFVVMDQDIVLQTLPDALEFWTTFLRSCTVDCVSAWIDYADVPHSYPQRDSVFQFYDHKLKYVSPVVMWSNFLVTVIASVVDTHFCVFRDSYWPKWHRHVSTFRSRSPYSLRHLDWYMETENPPPGSVHYLSHQKQVNHWGITRR